MPIDISNKEEKQIALTGTQIEETLLQAHLSKAAIEKINGLEASASQIDGVVGNSFKSLSTTSKSFYDLNLADFTPSGSNTAGIVEEVFLGEYGEKSIKITHTTDAGRIWFSKTVNISNADFVQRGGFIAQRIKVLSSGKASKLVFYFVMSDGTTYNLFPDTYKADTNREGEWQWVSFGINEIIPNNGAVALKDSTADLTKVHFGTLSAGKGFSVLISDYCYGIKQKPTFSFSFDDGNYTDYTIAKKMLDTHNFKATTGIIGKYISWGSGLSHNTGYLSDEQILSLYYDGWDIACHGEYTHNSLSTYTAIKDDVQYNLTEINKLGINPKIYTYIGGKYTSDSLLIMDELGFDGAMAIFLMNAPIAKHHKKFIGRRETTAYTIDQLKALVDSNIKDGGHLDLYSHKLTDTAQTYHTISTIFKELLQYIAEKVVSGECEVVKMSQIIKNMKD